MDQALTLSAAFLRAVRTRLQSHASFTLEEVRTRAWRSANFHGARHELALWFEGETAGTEADALLSELGREALSVPGQILAEWRLATEERLPSCVRLRIEALTVCC
jgi:hypothetical protein